MTDIKREDVERAVSALRPHANDENADARVFVALADEWLEARRARWNDYDAEHVTLDTDTRTVGSVIDGCEYEDEGSAWFAYYEGELVGVDEGYATKAEAQAVVEALAIADGYEIVREP